MARAQQQGSRALTVWFIVVMVMFVASIVMLVVLYTDQEQLRNDRLAAIAAKSRAVTDAEERSIALAKSAREGGPTIAGLLEEARAEAAGLAMGDRAGDTSAIRLKRDELVRRIKTQLERMAERDGSMAAEIAKFDDVSLFDGFEGVFRLLQREHDLRVEAETHAEDLGDKLDKAAEANAAGVKLLLGDDFGTASMPHGTYARELEVYVKHAGLSPLEVIRWATRNGAELMGMSDELGAIRENMLADLIVVDGDPTIDIAVLQEPARLAAIMKGGRFVKDDLDAPQG